MTVLRRKTFMAISTGLLLLTGISPRAGAQFFNGGFWQAVEIAPVLITGGTPIGNMVWAGGLGAAFDGNKVQVATSTATMVNDQTATRVIGKSWGSARTVRSSKIYGSSDVGLSNGGTNTIYFEGSNDGSNWVVLESLGAHSNAPGEIRETTASLDVSTAYSYHRWRMQNSNWGFHGYVAEIEFFE